MLDSCRGVAGPSRSTVSGSTVWVATIIGPGLPLFHAAVGTTEMGSEQTD